MKRFVGPYIVRNLWFRYHWQVQYEDGTLTLWTPFIVLRIGPRNLDYWNPDVRWEGFEIVMYRWWMWTWPLPVGEVVTCWSFRREFDRVNLWQERLWKR